MKMKRILFLTLSCWLFAIALVAAPALPIPVTVKQGDGTLLTIVQRGDEFHHWTETMDGTLVVSTAKGYCIAEIDIEGRLSATEVLAHEQAQRGNGELAAIKAQSTRRALFNEKARATMMAHRAVSINDKMMYLPHKGNVRILTVLAAFQDVVFTVNNPAVAFDQMLNGEEQLDMGNQNQRNMTSVRKYFETCSQGQFSPLFDVVGPITLPEQRAYYGGENKTGSDDKFTDFCKDVVKEAKELVPDWTIYDNNGDGNVELVCIIFAGYGQNQGGENSTIWAKATLGLQRLNDNQHIYRFNCCSELFHPQYPDDINGTGVFIHEFSHCMGLPDLYGTISTARVDNQGMESYSIMDYGLYNYNGFAPCAYNAWEQETMGWTEIADVGNMMTDGSCQIADMVPLIEGGKAYKMVNKDNDLDYIVMENIQQRGLNKKSSGHGLLVYHVDYPNVYANATDSPNNQPGHPSVAIVPAGGILYNSQNAYYSYTSSEKKACMAAAPFPGTMGVTSLTAAMDMPNYCFYNGEEKKPVGFMLSDICEETETGNISFTIAPDETTGIVPIENGKLKIENETDEVYDLQGRRVYGRLKAGIYITKGKKVVVRDPLPALP